MYNTATQEIASRCICSTCFQSFCCLQADITESGIGESTQQEVTGFIDADDTTVAAIASSVVTETTVDEVTTGELMKFLSRPIKINEYTWLESTAEGVQFLIDPWTLYLNTAVIKKKLDNYTWLRGDLKIKIVVTASPFYYGMMTATYQPLPLWTSNLVANAVVEGRILRSQRPHVNIFPAESLGGELTLPFLYPKNFVELQESSAVSSLGRITFDIVSTLDSANGATGTGVSVQTYAWMENPVLQAPGFGLALQSEYSMSGPVSSVASSVASYANKLTAWPFVGRFAKATSIGATAIGGIASLFGFTNVPVISPPDPVRPTAFPQLASTEIGFPTEKLTLDPKNELAIDGAPISMDLDDELQIAHLVQRESYLTKARWSTSNLVNDQLFRVCITPQLLWVAVSTNQRTMYHTPMAWVANLFQFWRGDVIIRLDFIKSKYHRGRVIVAWEPSMVPGNNVSTNNNPMGTVISQVVDIGAESSVEFKVPYAQALPWLETSTVARNRYTRNGTNVDEVDYEKGYSNGLLVVRVLNTLTAPVTSSAIDMVVSVRAAENLEFAGPRTTPDYSFWSTQSLFMTTPASTVTLGTETPPAPNRYLVNFGEQVRSLRQLMRRSTRNEVSVIPSDTTNQLSIVRHTGTKFPLTYGYDPAGVHTAKGLNVPASDFPFNWVQNTTYSYLAPAFAGVRGSMMWHYNVTNQSNGTTCSMPITSTRTPDLSVARTVTSLAVKTGANDARFYKIAATATGAGTAVTNNTTNAGLSVSMPMYNNVTFLSTSANRVNNPTDAGVDNSKDIDTYSLEVFLHPAQGQTTRAMTMHKYSAIGTDLSLNFFVNVPTLYEYISTPAA
jgi:hypothetical protein